MVFKTQDPPKPRVLISFSKLIWWLVGLRWGGVEWEGCNNKGCFSPSLTSMSMLTVRPAVISDYFRLLQIRLYDANGDGKLSFKEMSRYALIVTLFNVALFSLSRQLTVHLLCPLKTLLVLLRRLSEMCCWEAWFLDITSIVCFLYMLYIMLNI